MFLSAVDCKCCFHTTNNRHVAHRCCAVQQRNRPLLDCQRDTNTLLKIPKQQRVISVQSDRKPTIIISPFTIAEFITKSSKHFLNAANVLGLDTFYDAIATLNQPQNPIYMRLYLREDSYLNKHSFSS